MLIEFVSTDEGALASTLWYNILALSGTVTYRHAFLVYALALGTDDEWMLPGHCCANVHNLRCSGDASAWAEAACGT